MTCALCPAALAVLLAAAPALPISGGPARVVLLGSEPALARALATALAPWDIELVGRAAATADPAAEARAFGREGGRVAVVWIGAAEGGQALFVYDGANRQLVTRPLGGARALDEPLAAAAALSVKTMLRFTSVAPADERVAAEPLAPAPPRFRAEAFGGARLGRASLDRAEPSFGLGLSWWPAAAGGRLGVSLEARLGTGLAVDAAGFSGRASDLAAAAGLRGRAARGRLSLQPALAVGLHRSSLAGATTAEGPVKRWRLNPSLEAGLRLGFAPARAFEIGIGAAASYFLREQRYLLAGEPLTETSRVALGCELLLGVPLP